MTENSSWKVVAWTLGIGSMIAMFGCVIVVAAFVIYCVVSRLVNWVRGAHHEQ